MLRFYSFFAINEVKRFFFSPFIYLTPPLCGFLFIWRNKVFIFFLICKWFIREALLNPSKVITKNGTCYKIIIMMALLAQPAGQKTRSIIARAAGLKRGRCRLISWTFDQSLGGRVVRTIGKAWYHVSGYRFCRRGFPAGNVEPREASDLRTGSGFGYVSTLLWERIHKTGWGC